MCVRKCLINFVVKNVFGFEPALGLKFYILNIFSGFYFYLLLKIS